MVELSRAGEQRAEDGTLAQALRESLPVPADYPVFVPSVIFDRGGHRTAIHLMEGYAFVASGLPETTYFNLERTCPYVKKVLSIDSPSGLRTLSTIPDPSIEDMRRQLREQVACDLEIGMEVRVVEGVFENLEAKVVDIEGEEAHIFIDLRSLKILTTVPKFFLDPSSEDDEANA